MRISAVLFDADGVLTLPKEVFSITYARMQGIEYEPFEDFFKHRWREFAIGKKDLKEEIATNPDLWQWQGDADSLLDYWFKTEDVRNEALIMLIQSFGQKGLMRYLATEQEKYRAAYMKDIMFPGLFDGHFITSELGFTKNEPAFYESIITQLRTGQPDLVPEDIVFFDDSQAKIDTARSVGITAHLYQGVDQVENVLSNWQGNRG